MIRDEHGFRAPDPEHTRSDLWEPFVDHYLASETQPVVDMFLRGICGQPRNTEPTKENQQ